MLLDVRLRSSSGTPPLAPPAPPAAASSSASSSAARRRRSLVPHSGQRTSSERNRFSALVPSGLTSVYRRAVSGAGAGVHLRATEGGAGVSLARRGEASKLRAAGAPDAAMRPPRRGCAARSCRNKTQPPALLQTRSRLPTAAARNAGVRRTCRKMPGDCGQDTATAPLPPRALRQREAPTRRRRRSRLRAATTGSSGRSRTAPARHQRPLTAPAAATGRSAPRTSALPACRPQRCSGSQASGKRAAPLRLPAAAAQAVHRVRRATRAARAQDGRQEVSYCCAERPVHLCLALLALLCG